MKVSLTSNIILACVVLLAAVQPGCVSNKEDVGKTKTAKEETMKELQGKKVAMIVASDKFRDEELLKPKQAFEDNDMEVVVVSTTDGPIKGMLGATITADKLLEELQVDDFDAVVFVGGIGAQEYWENPKAHQIASQAVSKDKVLAAICIAPVILAKAGVLNGKKATVWKSEVDKLKQAGAQVEPDKPVVIDGKIITGNGPTAADKFAEAIMQALADSQ